MDRYDIVPGFRKIDILGEYYLISDKNHRKQFPIMQPINEMAALIWDSLSCNESLEEIAHVIVNEYDVAYSQALTDVNRFCSELCAKGYLSER